MSHVVPYRGRRVEVEPQVSVEILKRCVYQYCTAYACLLVKNGTGLSEPQPVPAPTYYQHDKKQAGKHEQQGVFQLQ